MRVNGEQIPETAVDAVKDYMQERKFFIAGEIREVLRKNGINQTWSTAERLIQRERKAGRIVHNEGRHIEWKWVAD